MKKPGACGKPPVFKIFVGYKEDDVDDRSKSVGRRQNGRSRKGEPAHVRLYGL